MGIEYLHSNKWGGFFILIFLETFGNKSLLVNISKRLLVISAEGHYRTVFYFLCYKQMSTGKKFPAASFL